MENEQQEYSGTSSDAEMLPGLSQVTYQDIPGSGFVVGDNDKLTLSTILNASRSYLATGDVAWLGRAIRAVSPLAKTSDCSRTQYDQITEMAKSDPTVMQNLRVMYLGLTSSEITASPVREYLYPDDNRRAAYFAEYVMTAIEQMSIPVGEARRKINWDALLGGHGFAELEWRVGRGLLGGAQVIGEARAISPRDILVVQDTFKRTIGFAPQHFPGFTPPTGGWLPARTLGALAFGSLQQWDSREKRESNIKQNWFLPKWKVWHRQAFATTDLDGTWAPGLAAWQPWYVKQQFIAQLLRLIVEESRPRKVATLSERSTSVCLYDALGNALVDGDGNAKNIPVEVAARKVVAELSGGTGAVLPYGATLALLETQPGWGTLILKALEYFDAEIAKAITGQSSATGGASGGTEHAGANHRDLLSLTITHSKLVQGEEIRHQLFRPMIESAFGDQASWLTPRADIGDGDGMPLTLDEAGFLRQSGMITDIQMPAMARRFGLPAITPQQARNLSGSGVQSHEKAAADEAAALNVDSVTRREIELIVRQILEQMNNG